MSDALLIFADSGRSMDLFHAIPAQVGDPFLYVEADGRRVAVISMLDQPKVEAAAPGIEVLDPFTLGRRELAQSGLDYTEADIEVARRAIERLEVSRATVSWDFPVALADALRRSGIEVTVDHRAFELRRRAKTPVQLDGIRRAQAAADAAMAVAADRIRGADDGLTAEDVRAAMQAVCADHDATLDDDVIVAPNAQGPAGHDPGSGPIRPGDVVIVDIWPRDRASRCWADMTRTFVAGGVEPPEEVAEFWRLSKAALDAVVPEVRPGAHGRALHDRASEVFEAAGQPTQRSAPPGELVNDGFFHALGHGVGLEVHEAPGVGLAGDELVAGDVIALEPGCYRHGFAGVRLEDIVLVTDGGCEVLTQFPYDL